MWEGWDLRFLDSIIVGLGWWGILGGAWLF